MGFFFIKFANTLFIFDDDVNSVATSRVGTHVTNLTHVIGLYSSGSFGKDRSQWAKCVITYLSEWLCDEEKDDDTDADESGGRVSRRRALHLSWLVFLSELLTKHAGNVSYQSCVLACIHSLLNQMDLVVDNEHQHNTHSGGGGRAWPLVNDDVVRLLVNYASSGHHPSLWHETLELIKMAVARSSSLAGLSTATSSSSSPSKPTQSALHTTTTTTSVPSVTGGTGNLFGKRELPGRTLTFDFDFAMFANANQSRNQHDQQPPPAPPPLNLLNPYARKELHQLIHYLNEGNSSHAPPRNAAASGGASAAVDWKRPHLSQARTRQRLVALLATMAVPAQQQQQQQQQQQHKKTKQQATSRATAPPQATTTYNKNMDVDVSTAAPAASSSSSSTTTSVSSLANVSSPAIDATTTSINDMNMSPTVSNQHHQAHTHIIIALVT